MMKRLCIFYKNADAYIGKQIDWIVCKQCQRKLRSGERLRIFTGIR